MSRLNTVVNFLNELRSNSVNSALGSLQILMNELEEKNDPEPIEMEIVDVAYQMLEKLNLLEAALRKYKSTDHILTGSKLGDLYRNGGSDSLLDD
jgi:Zn-dependent oligopeptidase